jgi:serine/alanine adding enzyme
MSECNIKLLTHDSNEWETYKDRVIGYVFNDAKAKFYHLPECCKLIQREFGHAVIYLLAIEDSEITGILPLVRQKSYLFGDHLISMPYFNYGGIVAKSEAVEIKLLEAAINIAKDMSVSDIELREMHCRQPLKNKQNKVTMLLDLKDQDLMWQSLGTKMRAQIKRPIQHNIKSKVGKAELLDDFYFVFSRNMRDLGTPVYKKSFFSSLIEAFEQYVSLHVVTINNEPVGAAFVIEFKDTVEVPWASTLREYNKYGTNMFMYWEILKYAINGGYKYFDFGRSSMDSGTYRFKKQWGAKPVQLYWNYWLAAGHDMPMTNTSNAKYALMINLWKKMPLAFTNWLGPKLARNLP